MDLFEFLQDCGLSDTGFPDTIMKWETDDFNVFYEVINKIISMNDPQPEDSRFTFVSNYEMSGGAIPCASLGCRTKNLDFLARNTLLYSDRVYLQNWFVKHSTLSEVTENDRFELANNLGLLYYIRPLLESGIMTFCSSEHHFCPSCYESWRDESQEEFEKKLKKARKYLTKKYSKEGVFTLEESFGKPVVIADGPELLFDHPIVTSFVRFIPDAIKEVYDPEKKIILNKKQISESGVILPYVEKLLEDLQYQNYYGNLTGSHYLTSREMDFKLLSKLNSPETNDRADLVYNHLSHAVPYIFDADLSTLLEFRQKEGESFQTYRDALNNVLGNLDETDPQKIKQALQDAINPELNKINLTIKNSKKLLWSDSIRNATIAATAVGISVYTGLLPLNIADFVKAAGGFQAVKEVGSHVHDMLRTPTDVKNENFYFLWKMKKKFSPVD